MKIQTIPTGLIQANSYLLVDEVSNDGVLIDCGAVEKKLIEAVDNVNLRAILLTHGHWDHLLGVAELKERTGAEVVIHTLDAPRLADSSLSEADKYGIHQTSLNADIKTNDGDILDLGSISLRVLHTPGHTEGGVCYIHEPSCSLFSGDTLFRGTCGRIDLAGGNWKTLRNSLRKLRDLDGDYDVYPGHDSATTLENERNSNRYMQERDS